MGRDFDGVNDRATGGSEFDNLTSLIVSMWFQPDDLSLGADSFVFIRNLVCAAERPFANFANEAWEISLDLRTGQDELEFQITNAAQDDESRAIIGTLTSKISTGNWYNVVAAWDGTSQKVWLSTGDTATAATPMADMSSTAETLKAAHGMNGASQARSFIGKVAYLAIWSNPGVFPTDAQAEELHFFHPFLSSFGLPTSFYPIGGNSSPEPDVLGVSTVLTLVSAPPKFDVPPVIHPAQPHIITAPAAVAFVPYPNPRYALTGGMQPMSAGV